VGECVAWWDKEHEEYVRKVLEEQPPGAYLMSVASAKEAMDKYFKMEKTRWQSMFMHDYFSALLRKDEDMKSLLREAYGKLAEAFDWPEKEPWTRIEENPLDFASDAADALFDFYAEKLRVEGWRSRVDEAVKEAKDRFLKEPSPIGDKFRAEYGRWVALKRIIHEELEGKLRLKDRVGYLFALEIETSARSVIRNTIRFPTYIENIIKEILDETETDYWWDMAMWHLHKAWAEFEEHKAVKDYGSYDNEELLIMAIMAADGVEPTEDEEKQRKYLEEIAARLNMPELVSLYYTSKFGPEEPRVFYKGIFKDWEEMTDDEKKFFEEQREASYQFMIAAGKAVQTLLARKGTIPLELIE
jgi:hypothetical protein